MANGGALIVPGQLRLYNLQAWTDSVWVNMAGRAQQQQAPFGDGRDGRPRCLRVRHRVQNSSSADLTGIGPGRLRRSVAYPNPSLSMTPGTWYMITFSASMGSYQFYVNGEPVATSPNYQYGGASNAAPQMVQNGQTSNLTIGAYASGYEDQISNASFADFQLYGSVLTPAQINAIYLADMITTGGGLPANTPVVLAAGATLGPERNEPDHRLALRRRQRGRRHGDHERGPGPAGDAHLGPARRLHHLQRRHPQRRRPGRVSPSTAPARRSSPAATPTAARPRSRRHPADRQRRHQRLDQRHQRHRGQQPVGLQSLRHANVCPGPSAAAAA